MSCWNCHSECRAVLSFGIIIVVVIFVVIIDSISALRLRRHRELATVEANEFFGECKSDARSFMRSGDGCYTMETVEDF